MYLIPHGFRSITDTYDFLILSNETQLQFLSVVINVLSVIDRKTRLTNHTKISERMHRHRIGIYSAYKNNKVLETHQKKFAYRI